MTKHTGAYWGIERGSNVVSKYAFQLFFFFVFFFIFEDFLNKKRKTKMIKIMEV